MEQTSIQQERPQEAVLEMMKEDFLKELYSFMRKKETPIERIPNLGFKQIDLFVMFKVVSELGGYQQVTTQQQWKQVYNTLGGNPRSTSAATCTRRHYEKLLLPFECHLTGKQVSVFPRTPPKHYFIYGKEQGDGQRPAKRRLLSMPLHQSPQILPPDLCEPVYPLAPYYGHPFHPSLAVLPPHIPVSSSVHTPHSPPAPTTWFPYPPPQPNPTDRSNEPLEQLRYLAEQYRTTSGLTEPLNLSVKAPRRESDSVPASSFAPPPSSNKSPKFLNKPSSLYALHRQRAERDDGRETQDAEACVIDLEATSASSSPSFGSAPTAGTDAGGPGEAGDRGPEVRRLPFGHMLPRITRENPGKMEIEVPLSVFHEWLRQCGSSAAALAAKEDGFVPRRRPDAEFFPADPTRHGEPRPRSPAAPAASDPFSIYKRLLLGGIMKSAAGQDAHPLAVNQLLVPKAFSAWDAYDKAAQASGASGNIDSGAFRAERDAGAATASSSCDGAPRAAGGSHAGHAAGLNHGSTSLLQLTDEEVIKLRRIISSSS